MNTVGQFVVGAYSIVAKNASLTLGIKSAKKVKRIIGHEAAAIKRIGKELSYALGGWLASVLHDVSADARDQILMQRFDVGDHPSRGDNAL